jgi:hypothetical protein
MSCKCGWCCSSNSSSLSWNAWFSCSSNNGSSSSRRRRRLHRRRCQALATKRPGSRTTAIISSSNSLRSHSSSSSHSSEVTRAPEHQSGLLTRQVSRHPLQVHRSRLHRCPVPVWRLLQAAPGARQCRVLAAAAVAALEQARQ